MSAVTNIASVLFRCMFAVFMVLTASSVIYSQTKESRSLGDIQSMYQRADYAGALKKLRALPPEKLVDSLQSLYQYLLGSAAFALDSSSLVEPALNRALKGGLPPDQQALAELRLGHVAAQAGKLPDAAGWYLVAATSDQRPANTLALTSLRALLARSDLDVQKVLTPFPITAKGFCKVIEQLGSIGKPLAQVPGFASLASDCVVPMGVSGKITVALVLPFSGDNASFALQVADGVESARAALGLQERMSIKRYDTRSRVVEAARLGRELRDSSCDLVIGPLTSEECAAFVLAAKDFHAPIIVPAASDVGLTSLHPNLYQLTPSLATEASLMASSAREFLGADTAVILVPDDDDYELMGELFAREFSARGGVILFRRTYDPRQRDFGGIFGDLKVAVGRGADSSRVMLNQAGDTLKPEHQPAGVDCIYAPCSAAQARALLPQLAFYTIQGAILGSTTWNDRQVYSEATAIAGQVFFPVAILDRGCNQLEQLRLSLQTIHGTRPTSKNAGDTPERLQCLGFDAVLLAARLSTDQMTLTDGSRDCGSAGMIAFGSDRTNQPLRLCQWKNGTPVAINVH